MRLFFALIPYRLLLPFVFAAAFPGWILKMLRRGGFGTQLQERAAIYTTGSEFEPCGAIHIHAVSVGEALLALKLIRAWQTRNPNQAFVLATGTATGHKVATAAAVANLRVTYAPLDFPSMVRRYLNRFEPSQVILIEGDIWPHMLIACRKRNIPVSLVNARISPRSARRYRKFAALIRPVFGLLNTVAIQEQEDSKIWRDLGVASENIHHTGSLKFDPGSGILPTTRPEFQQIIERFHPHHPMILAASTHAGEEVWLAKAIREAAPDSLIVIVPRHAERRDDVQQELHKHGFDSTLRSSIHHLTTIEPHSILVIDSTGELQDWTAHADVVIIGKSFLSTGGQNPSEAILAAKPVIFGPHMENFEPLASQLAAAEGAILATGSKSLVKGIQAALNTKTAAAMTRNASLILSTHDGATLRMIDLLTRRNTLEN